MKNILIVTTCRDNQGSAFSFVKNIEDIKEPILKEMIYNTIQNKNWESVDKKYWAYGEMCGSGMGYIFNDYQLPNLPLTIEHIIDYIFE